MKPTRLLQNIAVCERVTSFRHVTKCKVEQNDKSGLSVCIILLALKEPRATDPPRLDPTSHWGHGAIQPDRSENGRNNTLPLRLKAEKLRISRGSWAAIGYGNQT